MASNSAALGRSSAMNHTSNHTEFRMFFIENIYALIALFPELSSPVNSGTLEISLASLVEPAPPEAIEGFLLLSDASFSLFAPCKASNAINPRNRTNV